MAALVDIMGWRNISASVQKVETGIPDRLPPAFKTTTEQVLGDRTSYITFYGQRQTARQAQYGAPSRARTLRPVGEQSVTLLHFPEHIKVRQELLLRLRNPNDLLAQQMAQQEIARHGADFRQLFDNTRIATQVLMLSKGKLWFDAGGNVLATSSGANLTVDYGVGANNLNQLNGIIDVTWSNPAAPIIRHITNIGVQMKRNTGRDLKHAFYGKNVPNYLFTNTTLKAYWQFNSAMYDSFRANPGVVPKGFAGLEWHPMGDTFYATDNGAPTDTVTGLWDDDQVTWTPEIDRNVYTLYEGSIVVPKSFGVNPDVVSGAEHLDLVYGMGGYAVPEIDPVGIKEVYFDTMIPHWKNPLDLFIGDTTF